LPWTGLDANTPTQLNLKHLMAIELKARTISASAKSWGSDES
jgi:hypothetical protein